MGLTKHHVVAPMASHTASQKYSSTRGGSSGVRGRIPGLERSLNSSQVSFDDAVLKGLASDNGLFIPEEIPALPANWKNDWADLSFEDLASKS